MDPPRFITPRNAQIELAPWGKHWWLSRPGFTDTKQLTLVRVTMRPVPVIGSTITRRAKRSFM
jgi:hypothetical protein